MTAARFLVTRFKLIFYAPLTAVQECKAALFTTGVGRYPGPGNCTECCFTTIGTGQFRPGQGAKPFIGEVGSLEEVQEGRVEFLIIGEDLIKKAVAALKSVHPYDEPAYEVYMLGEY